MARPSAVAASDRVAERLVRGRQPELRGRVVRVGGAGLFERRGRLGRVVQTPQPQLADLGREGGALEGTHRQRGLELGDLQGEVPAIAPRVDAAQLGERGAQARVEAERLLVASDGIVARSQRSSSTCARRSSIRLRAPAVPGGVELGREQALRVQVDERGPAAGDEVRLFERFERDAIARIGGEARR